jgi:hypothetical protein
LRGKDRWHWMTKSSSFPISNRIIYLSYSKWLRYGWFSYNFEFLFYVNNVEFILQERSNGYDLRVAGKDFYQSLMRKKKSRHKSKWKKKQMIKEMSNFSSENISVVSMQQNNRYFYQVTPEIISLNSFNINKPINSKIKKIY